MHPNCTTYHPKLTAGLEIWSALCVWMHEMICIPQRLQHLQQPLSIKASTWTYCYGMGAASLPSPPTTARTMPGLTISPTFISRSEVLAIRWIQTLQKTEILNAAAFNQGPYLDLLLCRCLVVCVLQLLQPVLGDLHGHRWAGGIAAPRRAELQLEKLYLQPCSQCWGGLC